MREYEKEIILKLLSESGLTEIELPASEDDIQIRYTGAGYYLDFTNASILKERVVLRKPNISGFLGETQVGFIAFMENSEFTLECYAFDEICPDHCRDNDFIASAT